MYPTKRNRQRLHLPKKQFLETITSNPTSLRKLQIPIRLENHSAKSEEDINKLKEIQIANFHPVGVSRRGLGRFNEVKIWQCDNPYTHNHYRTRGFKRPHLKLSSSKLTKTLHLFLHRNYYICCTF